MRGISLLAALCAGAASDPVWSQDAGPVTVEALFQSCTDEGYGTNCMFYGQGQAFETNERFGTAPELMQSLADLPVNTPLRITGEDLGGNEAGAVSRLALSGFEPGPDDPHAQLRGLVQGDWLWADQPDYGLRVTGSEWLSLFAGQETEMMMLHIADACPGAAAEAVPVAILRGYRSPADEITCLRLDEIDAGRMLVYEARTDAHSEWRRP